MSDRTHPQNAPPPSSSQENDDPRPRAKKASQDTDGETSKAKNQANLRNKERMFQYGWEKVPRFLMRMEELSASAKLVLVFLLGCVRAQGGGRCFPGEDLIALNTGLGRNTVVNAIKALITCGLLVKLARTTFWGSNTYSICEVPRWILKKYGNDKDFLAGKPLKDIKPETVGIVGRAGAGNEPRCADLGHPPTGNCASTAQELDAQCPKVVPEGEQEKESKEGAEGRSRASVPSAPSAAPPGGTSSGNFSEGNDSSSSPPRSVSCSSSNDSRRVEFGERESAEDDDDLGFPKKKKAWLKAGSHPERLFARFCRKVAEESYAGGALPQALDGKSASLLRKLFEDPQFEGEKGLEFASECVDCLAADWLAIKDARKFTSMIPDVVLLYILRADLKAAVSTGNGYTTAIHRSSLWAARNAGVLKDRKAAVVDPMFFTIRRKGAGE